MTKLKRQPKHKDTIEKIERIKVYIRDNPTCSLKDAAIVLGVKHSLVRKWKSLGFFEHMTPAVARRAGVTTRAEATAVIDRQEIAQAYIERTQQHKQQHGSDTCDKTRQKQASGDVVSFAGMSAEIDQLIDKGKDLKISQIRSLIKSHLILSVGDSKAVSNYAAGLRALSGVQNVELEDIYESEQLIKIYVPEEDAETALNIIEVPKIEY